MTAVAEDLTRGISVERKPDGGITLRYQRGTWDDLMLLVTVAGLLALLLWGTTLTSGILALLVAAFSVPLYVAMGRATNRTLFHVDREGLTIDEGSLAWWRKERIPRTEIAAIAIVPVAIKRAKKNDLAFNLHVETTTGESHLVLKGLKTKDRALILKRVLAQEFALDTERGEIG